MRTTRRCQTQQPPPPSHELQRGILRVHKPQPGSYVNQTGNRTGWGPPALEGRLGRSEEGMRASDREEAAMARGARLPPGGRDEVGARGLGALVGREFRRVPVSRGATWAELKSQPQGLIVHQHG